MSSDILPRLRQVVMTNSMTSGECYECSEGPNHWSPANNTISVWRLVTNRCLVRQTIRQSFRGRVDCYHVGDHRMVFEANRWTDQWTRNTSNKTKDLYWKLMKSVKRYKWVLRKERHSLMRDCNGRLSDDRQLLERQSLMRDCNGRQWVLCAAAIYTVVWQSENILEVSVNVEVIHWSVWMLDWMLDSWRSFIGWQVVRLKLLTKRRLRLK